MKKIHEIKSVTKKCRPMVLGPISVKKIREMKLVGIFLVTD